MQTEEKNAFLEELARLKLDEGDKPKIQFKRDNVISTYKNIILGSGYSSQQLAKLDQCNYLENYLLPNYQQTSFKELDMSVVAMINFKFSHGVHFWEYFKDNKLTAKFALLFRNILDIDKITFEFVELSEFVSFLMLCFKYTEEEFISEQTSKLLEMSIIKLLSKGYLKALFLKYPKYITFYKKLKSAELPKESLYMRNLTLLFWNRLVDVSSSIESIESAALTFFEKFVELLCDLLGQHSTRRALKFYLEDTKFVLKAKLSKLVKHEKGKKFGLMIDNLSGLTSVEINEETGLAFSAATVTLLHYDKMNEVQNLLFKDFREKLGSSAIKNINNLDSQKTLLDILDYLSDEDILQVCQRLNLSFPMENEFNTYQVIFREDISYIDFIVNIVVDYLVPKTDSASIIEETPLYPTQELLWDSNLIPSEQQTFKESLPVPKLNLQFLSYKDYLARNYQLFQLESAFEIRKELEDIVPRTNPSFHEDTGAFKGFEGWARMGCEIKEFTIHNVQQAKIGQRHASSVLAEIKYSVATMPTYLRKEWETLKKHDVVMLVSFGKEKPSEMEDEGQSPKNFREAYGVQYVRGCEVVSHLDEKRRELNNLNSNKRFNPEGNFRYLQVLMDPIQYEKDIKLISDRDTELYSHFNLIVRRKPKENNFKPILATIKDLFSTEIVLPNWLEDTILGYGEAEDAFYRKILENKKKANKQIQDENTESKDSESFNYFDTFLDEDHYKEVFVNNESIPKAEKEQIEKPFHLEVENSQQDQRIAGRLMLNESVSVSTSASKAFSLHQKRNKIRFTKSQTAAIHASMHEGLTLIEGPPGTGKTDVAVQILSLLFNNFVNERTLIITHSNHALNDLFEKIVNLNINERYLLRLGMGEKELSTEQDFSKQGRIDYMLTRRLFLLQELKILSESLKLNVYEDFTCENAQIFLKCHIKSRWDEYQQKILNTLDNISDTPENAAQIGAQFPFSEYLSRSRVIALNSKFDNPNGLYFEGKVVKHDKEQALFYWEVLSSIFNEVEECRAFELLRNNRERGNFLVSRQARVVAMTSTHAALKRAEFLETGFEFENIIIEESAQILEIETFIPFMLQKPNANNKAKLKRIVLIGDHNQLPPIIKNKVFQRYYNMEQSMYARLLRLGVRSFKLKEQGRCRESLLELFRWKYPGVRSLDSVLPTSENTQYALANTGFAYEYQFVNVSDYNGKGETTPSPYFYQNLAEAEYIVATYMLMILNGIPAKKISILTTYNGQKFLIRDIFHKKCSWNPIFKKPAKITTVDKYQGQQNDYILLSLVRTENIGHLRDPRRICVAFSRARLGLYVFGRYNLFKECYELRNTFTKLSTKPHDLAVIPEDTYPTERKISEKPNKEVKAIKNFTEIYELVQEKLKISS